MTNNKKSGIYKITNNVTGAIYIGSSCNIGSRWDVHKRRLRNNNHHSKYMQRSYNKYGQDCLDYEVIVYCPKEDLIPIEQYYIDTYNPEYNSSKIAGSSLGTKLSEETKRKISVAGKGRKHTKDSILKMSLAQKGRKISVKAKENMRNARLGKEFPGKWKPIVQLQLNTTIIINKFNSVKEAAKELNISQGNISSVALGKRPNAGGYSWKYVKDLEL